jgi:Lon protease-like protein
MPSRAARELPLFPLAEVVLFPRVRAPLHVFEPRYRQVMAAALAGDRAIGMAVVRPEHAAAMAGDPPIFEVGCAGFVEAWERLADGRYNLVLRGTERFRVLRERPRGPERLYRVAEVELLAELLPRPEDASALDAARHRVLERVEQLAARTGGGALPLSHLLALDHETFANALCQTLALPADEKQGLLEAPGPLRRLELLEGILHFHWVKLTAPAGAGSDAVH